MAHKKNDTAAENEKADATTPAVETLVVDRVAALEADLAESRKLLSAARDDAEQHAEDSAGLRVALANAETERDAAIAEARAAHELLSEATNPTPKAAVDVGEPAIYSVDIENCLVGQRFVLATSSDQALTKYKAVCGITANAGRATAVPTEFTPETLPEGVELFGEQ